MERYGSPQDLPAEQWRPDLIEPVTDEGVDPPDADRVNPGSLDTATDCLASPDAQGPVDEPEPRDLGDDPDPTELGANPADDYNDGTTTDSGGSAREQPSDAESAPKPTGSIEDGPPPPRPPSTARGFTGDEPVEPAPSGGEQPAGDAPDPPATNLPAGTGTGEPLPPVPTEPLPDIAPAPGAVPDAAPDPGAGEVTDAPVQRPEDTEPPVETIVINPGLAPIEPAQGRGIRQHFCETGEQFDSSFKQVLVEGDLVGPDGETTPVRDLFLGNARAVDDRLGSFVDRAAAANGAVSMELTTNDMDTPNDLAKVVGTRDALSLSSNARADFPATVNELYERDNDPGAHANLREEVRRHGFYITVDLTHPQVREGIDARNRRREQRPEGE